MNNEEERVYMVRVVRPCILVGVRHEPSEDPVPLNLRDAQDAVSSGRCVEVDRLPRLQNRP